MDTQSTTGHNGVPNIPEPSSPDEAPDFMDIVLPLIDGDDLATLGRIENLQQDWDSYGGAPITATAIGRARRVLGMSALFNHYFGSHLQTYAIAPLADGGVQLEWRGPSGELAVEVGPDGDLGYLFESGECVEEAEDVGETAIIRVIACLGQDE